MTYLLERIKDSRDFPKGIRYWCDQPCKGWRIIAKCDDSGRITYLR